MTPFLTVKEASQLTGKSPSSIRRIIYPIIHDDGHPDRSHIQPSVDDALQLRLKGENFAWRLSEELLRRAITASDPADNVAPFSAAKAAARGEADLLAMLRAELQIKNQQIGQQSELIARQMELINGLSERLREGNVLIGTLQQRLSLPEHLAVKHEAVKHEAAQHHPAKSTSPVKPKPSSASTAKGSSIAPKSPKPKKGFLARMFGS